MSRIVIVHDEMGIYVGNCLGLGFFTLLDCGGQPMVCTFPDEEEARKHIASWDTNNDPNAYRYVSISTDDDWVGYDTLAAVGLEEQARPLLWETIGEGNPQ